MILVALDKKKLAMNFFIKVQDHFQFCEGFYAIKFDAKSIPQEGHSVLTDLQVVYYCCLWEFFKVQSEFSVHSSTKKIFSHRQSLKVLQVLQTRKRPKGSGLIMCNICLEIGCNSVEVKKKLQQIQWVSSTNKQSTSKRVALGDPGAPVKTLTHRSDSIQGTDYISTQI